MKQNRAFRRDFEELALPQLEDLYNTASLVLDDEARAQELVIESLVNAYHAWDECRSNSDRRLWLFKIMAKSYINKYQPFPNLADATNDGFDEVEGFKQQLRPKFRKLEGSPIATSMPASKAEHVRDAIRALPADVRLIVVLSLLAGFSHREIANIAGIHLDTVKSRLPRGRNLIRENFSNMWRAQPGHVRRQSQELQNG